MRELRGYNRDIRLYMLSIGISSFTLSTGIFPVLFNLYLLRLGYGPEFVGAVYSVGALGMALFALPSSALAGRWGLRKSLVVGLALAALSYGLMPLAHILPGVGQDVGMMAARLLGSLGMSLYFVNSVPFLVGVASPHLRASVCAFQVVASQLLGLVGSLVGGVLPGVLAALLSLPLQSPVPYRLTLLFAALVCLAAAWTMSRANEPQPDPRPRAALPSDPPKVAAPVMLIAILAAAAMLQTACVGVSKTFFNVYLDDYLGISTGSIGAIFAVVQLLSAIAAMIMPRLMARWGPNAVFILSSLGSAAGMLPLAFIPQWGAALLGRTVVSAFASITFPALNVLQMELVLPEWRSAINGAVNMTKQVSWMIISLVGGFIIAALGYRALFLVGMAATLAGTFLFWVYFRVPRGEYAQAAMGEREGQRCAVEATEV